MQQVKVDPMYLPAMASMVEAGETYAKVGFVYGVTAKQVSYALKHAGYTFERKSSLELGFDTFWQQTMLSLYPGAPMYQTQYQFTQTRNWRFDVAWRDYTYPVAIELHGGIHSGGRHARGKGIEGDLEKNNAAIALGWVVLTFTTGMLTQDPASVAQHIAATMICRKIPVFD